MEEHETPWDAAVREVREEVGLDVEVTRLTGLYWKPATDELVFNFECRVTAGTPGTSDEADAVEYFPTTSLPSNTAPKQVERIVDALARVGTPFLKSQSGRSTRDVVSKRHP